MKKGVFIAALIGAMAFSTVHAQTGTKCDPNDKACIETAQKSEDGVAGTADAKAKFIVARAIPDSDSLAVKMAKSLNPGAEDTSQAQAKEEAHLSGEPKKRDE